MLKIGLTGGIGSGKSTVAKIFELLGIPVYYADTAAKHLMNNNEALKAKIIENFGNDSYVNGQLNKSFISQVVFSDSDKANLFNTFVHPVTIADANTWMQQQKAPYAIKEAAILFEANAQKELDLVIGVSSPLELRLKRVMQRDGIDENAVMVRIKKQMDQAEKMKLCDFVIENNETELLIPQVIALHEKLITNIGRLHN
jgi:dephospho-CoA kinase